tara:strand:- start:467 stop:649 length:183 start_codon:yes stop_codon:yes gene_type:complete
MTKSQFNISLPDFLIEAVKLSASRNIRNHSEETEAALRSWLNLHDDLYDEKLVKAAGEVS